MKVRMMVKHMSDRDDQAWEEEFDTETTGCLHDAPEGMEARDYAELVINYFNSTLKPGEMVRDFVSAEEID